MKHKTIVILSLVLLCFLGNTLSAQVVDKLERDEATLQDDSLRLRTLLNAAWDQYDAFEYQAAINLIRDDLVQFDSAQYVGMRRESRILLTYAMSFLGKSDSLRLYWQQTFDLASAANDTFYLTSLYNVMANKFVNELKYDSAFLFFRSGLNLALEADDILMQNSIYNNVAIIFGEQKQFEKAKENFFKVAINGIATKDTMSILLGYMNMTRCFIDMGEADSATHYLSKSYPYLQEEYKTLMFPTYHQNSGRLARTQGELYKAIVHYREAAKGFSKTQDAASLARVHIEMGRTFYELEQYDSTLLYLQLAETANVDMKSNEFVRDIWPLQAKIYAGQENWEKAYEYAQKTLDFREEYLASELNRELAEMEAQYQLETFERENENLKLVAAEREEKIQERTRFAAVGFLGLVLISILGFILWRRSKTIDKLNEELENRVAERTLELESANTQLQEYLDDLRMFTHVTSHDLKEPLRNISGFSSLLQRKLNGHLTEDTKTFMEMIRVNAGHMHRLIEGVKFYATLGPDGETNDTLETVSLTDTLRDVEHTLSASIEEKNARIEYPDQLPDIFTASSVLQIVLKNLVENGLKYNRLSTPTVWINYEKTEDAHLIHVKDNGIGIEPLYHEQIFEMFKRLHNRQEFEGTGMGLGICRKLTRQIDGDITVRSALGQGSTFTLHLPIVAPSSIVDAKVEVSTATT